jgi:ATP-binding protein involved in chromosome partitioning
VVENMAVHVCSNCGHAEHIFGEGGGKRYAPSAGIDYLGALPLDMHIREQADSGKPTVVADPDGEAGRHLQGRGAPGGGAIAGQGQGLLAKFPTITVSKNT